MAEVQIPLLKEEVSVLQEFLSDDFFAIVSENYNGEYLTIDVDKALELHEICVDRTIELGFDEDDGGKPRGNGLQIEAIYDKIFDAMEGKVEPSFWQCLRQSDWWVLFVIIIAFTIFYFPAHALGGQWLNGYYAVLLFFLTYATHDEKVLKPVTYGLSSVLFLTIANMFGFSLQIGIGVNEITLAHIIITLSVLMGIWRIKEKPFFFIKLTSCAICGNPFESVDDPFDSCACCGVRVNYWAKSEYENKHWVFYIDRDKNSKEYLLENRQFWLNNKNAAWFFLEEQPKNWDKEKALAQIKANVPAEFQ